MVDPGPPWVVVLPLVTVWSFQLDGIFIGAIRSAEMRNAMLLSVAVFLAAEAVLVRLWDNHGLWAALLVLMLARALTLAVLYPRIERGLTAPPHDPPRPPLLNRVPPQLDEYTYISINV